MRLAAEGLSREITAGVPVADVGVSGAGAVRGGVYRREVLGDQISRPGCQCGGPGRDPGGDRAGASRCRSSGGVSGGRRRSLGKWDRNGGRAGYRPIAAQRRSEVLARRPKVTKLADDAELCARVVTTWLESWWSPEEIADRLPIEFPHDPMIACHTRPSTSASTSKAVANCAVSWPGACAAAELSARDAGTPKRGGGHIQGMVMISERPPRSKTAPSGPLGGGPAHRQSRTIPSRHPRGTHHGLPDPAPSP